VVFRGLGCVLSAFGVFACLSGLAWLHTLNPKPSFLKVPTQGTNTLSVAFLVPGPSVRDYSLHHLPPPPPSARCPRMRACHCVSVSGVGLLALITCAAFQRCLPAPDDVMSFAMRSVTVVSEQIFPPYPLLCMPIYRYRLLSPSPFPSPSLFRSVIAR